jgi:hyperosmotically inducible protein
MQKYLSNALVAGVILLLVGCQNGTSGPTLFSSYPSFPSFSSSGMSLVQTVQNALSRNEDPIIARVHVEAAQNTVILTGYVKKIRQSDVAEQIAHQASGGLNVQNNIIVRQ